MALRSRSNVDGKVDPENGIFKLDKKSPCRDAGNQEPVFFDSDGSKNDIGAYGGPNGFSEK